MIYNIEYIIAGWMQMRFSSGLILIVLIFVVLDVRPVSSQNIKTYPPIVVQAKSPWKGHGIRVEIGDNVSVNANPGDTWATGATAHPVGADGEQNLNAIPMLNDALHSWWDKVFVQGFGDPPLPSWWPDHTMKLHARIDQGRLFPVGMNSTFTVQNAGILTFGHTDPDNPIRTMQDGSVIHGFCDDNLGFMTVTVTVNPALQPVAIPGIPGLIPNQQNPDGITGLKIVEEDSENSWNGVGQTTVILTPGVPVKYTFDFGDPLDPAPWIDSFDPAGLLNIAQRISGKHKYKENGLYDINLKIEFSQRIYNPDGTFADRQETFHTNPFTVIVVDHAPQFTGNAIFMINGPGNATGKPYPTMPKTDVIFEDDATKYNLLGLFKFFAELPPGSDTGVDPDRFSGVDPATVKYRIDFGDGTPETAWIPYDSVNQVRPKNIYDPIVQESFPSAPFTHEWMEPGTCRMKVTMTYQEISYVDIKFNGTIYTYRQERSGWLEQVKTQNIIVIDRTPPRILKDELRKYTGTTGDEMEVQFKVEDNSKIKDLKSAQLFYEDWGNRNSFKKIDLNILKTGPSQIRGDEWELSGKLKMPENFAHKSLADPLLRYYVRIIDGEDNENISTTTVTEDTPPFYGTDKSGCTFGDMQVIDNDPPGLTFTVEARENSSFCAEIKEGVADEYQNGTCVYKDVQVCYPVSGMCQMKPDPVLNPMNPGGVIIPVQLEESAVVFEDTRFSVRVSSTDNVDGTAQRVFFLLDDAVLSERMSGEVSEPLLISQPGEKTFSLQVEDRANIDGTRCYRKVSWKVKVVPMNTKFQTLNHEK